MKPIIGKKAKKAKVKIINKGKLCKIKMNIKKIIGFSYITDDLLENKLRKIIIDVFELNPKWRILKGDNCDRKKNSNRHHSD